MLFFAKDVLQCGVWVWGLQGLTTIEVLAGNLCTTAGGTKLPQLFERPAARLLLCLACGMYAL